MSVLDEDWAVSASSEAFSRTRRRSLTLSSETVMAMGLVWAMFGWLLEQFYWLLGGFLLFMMGTLTLAPLAGDERN